MFLSIIKLKWLPENLGSEKNIQNLCVNSMEIMETICMFEHIGTYTSDTDEDFFHLFRLKTEKQFQQ